MVLSQRACKSATELIRDSLKKLWGAKRPTRQRKKSNLQRETEINTPRRAVAFNFVIFCCKWLDNLHQHKTKIYMHDQWYANWQIKGDSLSLNIYRKLSQYASARERKQQDYTHEEWYKIRRPTMPWNTMILQTKKIMMTPSTPTLAKCFRTPVGLLYWPVLCTARQLNAWRGK